MPINVGMLSPPDARPLRSAASRGSDMYREYSSGHEKMTVLLRLPIPVRIPLQEFSLAIGPSRCDLVKHSSIIITEDFRPCRVVWFPQSET